MWGVPASPSSPISLPKATWSAKAGYCSNRPAGQTGKIIHNLHSCSGRLCMCSAWCLFPPARIRRSSELFSLTQLLMSCRAKEINFYEQPRLKAREGHNTDFWSNFLNTS